MIPLNFIIKAGEKIREIDPGSFLTQDNVQAIFDLIKELIKP